MGWQNPILIIGHYKKTYFSLISEK